MNAAAGRLQAAANNVANVATTGASAKTAYQPSHAVHSEARPSGVNTRYVYGEESSTPVYGPSHPHADENGIVHYPDVQLEREMVDMQTAASAYKMNAAAFRTQDEMTQTILDMMR